MPVTARLSKLFYERMGEQVANELVDWFNQVDATYRSDLRDLNDRNFALFDARLEQRFGVLEAKLEQRFVALEAKFEQRFATIDQRFTTLEATFNARIVASENRMLRWMVAFWATTTLTILLK